MDTLKSFAEWLYMIVQCIAVWSFVIWGAVHIFNNLVLTAPR